MMLACHSLLCMVPHRSKADEVTDERDRQRVLIQITQNLATRIRNSHAFNLPTFYLPHEDDGGLPCSIPNAIEDVCEEIDKVSTRSWRRGSPRRPACKACNGPACRVQKRLSILAVSSL